MGLISWIVFGALAGWVASIVVGTRKRQGCITDIFVGVVGALIGGFLVGFLQGGDRLTLDSFGWDMTSFIVAVIGAIVLLIILRVVRR